MRATYLLNQEKLEYNFRVLTERDVENSNTVLQQKKKLQRLKDSLAKLTTRYQTADAHFKQVNGKLAAEYHKLTDQVGGQLHAGPIACCGGLTISLAARSTTT